MVVQEVESDYLDEVSTSLTDRRRTAYEALDPQHTLTAGAPAYTSRPDPPFSRLIAKLRFAGSPGVYLVSGHIGVGKSTELARLPSEVSTSHETLVEYVDADLLSNLPGEGAFVLMLCASVRAIEQNVDAATILHGHGLTKALDTLIRWLGSSAEAVGTAAGFGHLTASIGSSLLKSSVTTPIDPATLIRDSLADAKRAAQVIRGRGREPLVILDGFDKFSLADLERIFTQVSVTGIPVPVIVTVPLSFLFTPLYSRIQYQMMDTAVVPSIRVARREGGPDEAGIAWMEQVLLRRGVLDMFEPEAARILAMQTGGLIRDMIRTSREALLTAFLDGMERVSAKHAMDAIENFGVQMTRPLSGDDLRVLYAVDKLGRVVNNSACLRMIDAGQIIEYRNGRSWYAIHPLLRETVLQLAPDVESETIL